MPANQSPINQLRTDLAARELFDAISLNAMEQDRFARRPAGYRRNQAPSHWPS
jgi:hypothetical protein